MRDLLLEVVNVLEDDPNCTDEMLQQTHNLEEAVVEWIRENTDSIIKG